MFFFLSKTKKSINPRSWMAECQSCVEQLDGNSKRDISQKVHYHKSDAWTSKHCTRSIQLQFNLSHSKNPVPRACSSSANINFMLPTLILNASSAAECSLRMFERERERKSRERENVASKAQERDHESHMFILRWSIQHAGSLTRSQSRIKSQFPHSFHQFSFLIHRPSVISSALKFFDFVCEKRVKLLFLHIYFFSLFLAINFVSLARRWGWWMGQRKCDAVRADFSGWGCWWRNKC